MWRPGSQISPGNQARNWLLKQQTWGYLVLEVNANPTDQCAEEKGLSYKQLCKLSLPNYLTRLTGKMRPLPPGKADAQFPKLMHFSKAALPTQIKSGLGKSRIIIGLSNNKSDFGEIYCLPFYKMSYRHLIHILPKKEIKKKSLEKLAWIPIE